MEDLYSYIKAMKHKPASRTGYFQESLLNRLGGLLSGNLGKIFDCSIGIEESLLRNNVIFEIDSLTREQQIFITNLLISNLFYYRINND